MNTFVILFRKTGPAPTDAERRQVGAEVAPWAQALNAAGHELVPHILAAQSARCGEPIADATPVTALLLLKARDLDEAARIAATHPGTRYGFALEVRPWSPPGVAATATSTAAV